MKLKHGMDLTCKLTNQIEQVTENPLAISSRPFVGLGNVPGYRIVSTILLGNVDWWG